MPPLLVLQKPRPFVAVGLRYCAINMSVPGLYGIKYTGTADDGSSDYVERYLIIQADCAAGEVRGAAGRLLSCRALALLVCTHGPVTRASFAIAC